MAEAACVSANRGWGLVDVGSIVENPKMAAVSDFVHRIPFSIRHLFHVQAALDRIRRHRRWDGHTDGVSLSKAAKFKLNYSPAVDSLR